MALDRYEEAFEAASVVTKMEGSELTLSALLYMADSRMLQCRVSEALQIYLSVRAKLPNKHADPERVARGVERTIAFLEKQSKQPKAF